MVLGVPVVLPAGGGDGNVVDAGEQKQPFGLDVLAGFAADLQHRFGVVGVDGQGGLVAQIAQFEGVIAGHIDPDLAEIHLILLAHPVVIDDIHIDAGRGGRDGDLIDGVGCDQPPTVVGAGNHRRMLYSQSDRSVRLFRLQ
ncbi:hypothetical protein SDC9_164420 [bioreactor metagenome]|uniref:Uncharacterized protein n=1 Tax=bioreactor metagenome TaxID=1076179 RepID=A0A645FT26_9ZZZZ